MWGALKSWLFSPASSVALGTVADVSMHIQRLLDAPEGSWLIIELTEADDAFVQLSASPDEIQIDHPLITADQVAREDGLRKVITAAGLTPYETRGSEGSRFLDCDVPRDAARATIVVQRILESLFGSDSSTEVRFIGEGLPPGIGG